MPAIISIVGKAALSPIADDANAIVFIVHYVLDTVFSAKDTTVKSKDTTLRLLSFIIVGNI